MRYLLRWTCTMSSRRIILQLMSGEAIFRTWLLVCAAVGLWRAVSQFRRAPEPVLWQVEGILSLVALGLAALRGSWVGRWCAAMTFSSQRELHAKL